jgi:hypothetical protein
VKRGIVTHEFAGTRDAPDVKALDVSSTGALIVWYGTPTFNEGVVRVYPRGHIDSEFENHRVSAKQEEAYIEHAIRVWRALTGDWETDFEFRLGSAESMGLPHEPWLS